MCAALRLELANVFMPHCVMIRPPTPTRSFYQLARAKEKEKERETDCERKSSLCKCIVCVFLLRMCLCGGVLMPEIESAPRVCECVCLKSFEHSKVRWLKDRFLYVLSVSGIILNFKQLSKCVVLMLCSLLAQT